MKKLFGIILLVLFILPLFAAPQTHTVIIRSTVTTISLSQAFAHSGVLGLYKLSGGLDTSSEEGDYLMANDISEGDINVYFRVDQLAKTRTEETIQLSISADRLVNTEASLLAQEYNGIKTETDYPAISVVSCANTDALQVNSAAVGSSEVLFTLRYLGYRTLENINVVLFRTTWKKTTGLAPGMYTSNITLSYIMN